VAEAVGRGRVPAQAIINLRPYRMLTSEIESRRGKAVEEYNKLYGPGSPGTNPTPTGLGVGFGDGEQLSEGGIGGKFGKSPKGSTRLGGLPPT
jgi:hypothetical protein